MVTILDSNDFEYKVLQSDNSVLVYFFAGWCPPCKMISPIIDELAEEYENKIEFFKVDFAVSKDLVEKYEISKIPTLLLFSKGEVVARQTGAIPKKSIIELFKDFLHNSLDIFYIYGAMRSGKTHTLEQMKNNGNSVYMTCTPKTEWKEIKSFISENEGKDICIDELQFAKNYCGNDYIDFIFGFYKNMKKSTRIYFAFLLYNWKNEKFKISADVTNQFFLYYETMHSCMIKYKLFKKFRCKGFELPHYSACSECGAPGMYHTKIGGDKKLIEEEDKSLYQVRCSRCKVIVDD